jgi:hypothetical protein
MNMYWLYDFMKWPEAIPFYRLNETQHFLFGWDEQIGFEEMIYPLCRSNILHRDNTLKIPCYPVESKNV